MSKEEKDRSEEIKQKDEKKEKSSSKKPKEDEIYSDPLDVLFPKGEVSLPDGSKVKVRPLSLSQLPDITEAFGNILIKASESRAMAANGPQFGKASTIDFIGSAASEIFKLLPYTIDRDPDEVPITAIPDILFLVVAQNITPELIKKWKALIQTGEKALKEQFGIALNLDQGKLTELRKGLENK